MAIADCICSCTAGSLPGLHSHISAPGIVMAVGNVGEYLDFAADSTCTWLSRDGGVRFEIVYFTWC